MERSKSGLGRSNSISIIVDGTLQKTRSGTPCRPVRAKTKGVVVLIGWLGCKEAQLRKYRQWWAEQGWEPFVACFPVSQILRVMSDSGDQSLVSLWVMRLEKKHADLTAAGGGGQIMIHTFSQTGWIASGLLLREWLRGQSPLLERVSGMVVDSAPLSRVSYKAFAAGFMTALWPKAAYKKHDVRAVMLRGFLKALIVGKRKQFLDDITAILRQHCAFPQLYIASQSDHVIPHASVSAWAEAQRGEGRAVRELRLERSPHVQHMRHHRDAYVAAVAKFVVEACIDCCPGDAARIKPAPV